MIRNLYIHFFSKNAERFNEPRCIKNVFCNRIQYTFMYVLTHALINLGIKLKIVREEAMLYVCPKKVPLLSTNHEYGAYGVYMYIIPRPVGSFQRGVRSIRQGVWGPLRLPEALGYLVQNPAI